MIPAAVLSRLHKLDLTDAQYEAVIALMDEACDLVGDKAAASIEARRASDRARKAKQRGTVSRDVTGQNGSHETSQDVTGRAKAAETRTHEGAHADEITSKTTTKIISKTPPSEGQKPKRTSVRTRIASDAQPSDRDRTAASEAGMDEPTFRHEWAKFRERHIAQGSTMADWSAAWRTWILNWQSFGSQAAGKVHNGFSPRAGPRPKPSVVGMWTEDILDEQHNHPSAETSRPALAYRG